MIRCKDIWKSFDGHEVLRGLNVEFRRGELVGLIGPSNGGKSVFLKILGGVLDADHGKVLRTGAKETGFLFQEGALFDSMSVLENVAFPLKEPRPTGPYRERMERAYAALSDVGLADHCSKLPGQLSGGMRRRAALARAVVGRPELVLLDDPTGGLDPVAASVIMNLISKLHAEHGSTVVVVSHDLRRLLPRVERLLCLFDGRLSADCAAGELREHADERILRFVRTRYDFSENAAAR